MSADSSMKKVQSKHFNVLLMRTRELSRVSSCSFPVGSVLYSPKIPSCGFILSGVNRWKVRCSPYTSCDIKNGFDNTFIQFVKDVIIKSSLQHIFYCIMHINGRLADLNSSLRECSKLWYSSSQRLCFIAKFDISAC